MFLDFFSLFKPNVRILFTVKSKRIYIVGRIYNTFKNHPGSLGFSHKSDIGFRPQEAEQEIASKSIYFDVIHLRGPFERVRSIPCLETKGYQLSRLITFNKMNVY